MSNNHYFENDFDTEYSLNPRAASRTLKSKLVAMFQGRSRRRSMQIGKSIATAAAVEMLETRQLLSAVSGAAPDRDAYDSPIDCSCDSNSNGDRESDSAQLPAPTISHPGSTNYDGLFATDVQQRPAAAGTVTLEFRTDTTQRYGTLVGHFNLGNPNHRIYLSIQGDDLYARLGGGNDERVAQNVTDGHWHELAFVYGGQPDLAGMTPSVYLDGTLSGTVTAPGHRLATTSELKVGGLTDTRGGSQLEFRGEIRSVKFYDTLLTAQQIAGDSETTNSHCNPATLPTPIISLPLTTNYDGDFATDVQRQPAAAGTVTLEFRTDTTQSYGMLVGHFNLGNPNHRIYLSIQGDDLYARLGNGRDQRVAQNVTDGQWHQLAFVYGGQPDVGNLTPSVYLDGTLSGTVAAPGHRLVTTTELKIGGVTNTRGGSQLEFQGQIRNVDFYDTMLTAQQVADISQSSGNEGNSPQSVSPIISLPESTRYDGGFVTDVQQQPAAAGIVTLEFRTGTTQNYGMLVGHFNLGNSNHRIYLSIQGNDLYARLGSGRDQRVAQNVTDDQWHHVAFVYGGQPDLGSVSPSVYLDGTLSAAVTAPGYRLVTTTELKVGGVTNTRGGSQLRFQGEIRNVNFYDTVDINALASNDAETPVNNAPCVVAEPEPVRLTDAAPNAPIELDAIFADADGDSLAYAVTSSNTGDNFTFQIQGGSLSITSIADRVGGGSLTVRATDPAGETAAVSLSVNVDRPELQPLTEIQYAIASDQVIEFHGQNTFILTTNFNEFSRISVSSSNLDVIDVDDITVAPIGAGQHRVTVTHRSSDYGLTFLDFAVDGVVFAGVAAVVLPEAQVDASYFDDVKFVNEYSMDGEELQVTRLFNDSFLAMQLRDAVISPALFFSLVRPTTSIDMANVYARKHATFTHEIATSGSQSNVLRTVTSHSEVRQPHSVVKATINGADEFHMSLGLRDGPSFAQLFARNRAGEVVENYWNWSDYGSGFSSVANIAGDGVDLVSAVFSGSIFGSGSIALSLGAGNRSARIKTEYELSPWKFDNKQDVVQELLEIDAGALVGKSLLGFGSLVKNGLKQGVTTAAKYAAKNTANTEMVTAVENYYAGRNASVGSFVMSTESTRESVDQIELRILQRRKATNDAFQNVAFTSESLQQDKISTDSEIRRLGKLDSLTDSQSAELKLAKSHAANLDSQISQIAELAEAAQADLDKLNHASEALQDLTAAERAGATPESLADTVLKDVLIVIREGVEVDEQSNDEEGAEASGTNGDEQARVNEALREIYEDKHPELTSAISVGKKLYDISKSVQTIAGQVGQLFDAASRNEGDYTDNDGKTYNMYDAQRGASARHGSSGRDIINTSYFDDQVYAYAGDDRISTLDGDDVIDGGSGRNTYFAGTGNDTIYDGAGGSQMSSGDGDDTIYPGDGSDFIDSGIGHDTIIFEGADLGNNLVADPSRSGILRFTAISIDQLSFRKDKYDLEIIAESEDDRVSNSVKLVSFFEQDAAGWVVIDSLGNEYSLYELTGRISSYEALQIAFGDRGTTSVPVYPSDIAQTSMVTSTDGSLRVHIAEDRRLIGVNSSIMSPGLVVTFEGDATLTGWLNRNQFGSLSRATELFATLLPQLNLANYDRVTVVGVGEGGLIAQWFNAVAATKGASFVNAQLINSPDISGLISQVVRSDVQESVNDETVVLAEGLPEYTDGFPVLATNYLVGFRDWIPQIGIWAGNDETYATWKAFSFDRDVADRLSAVTELSELEFAHDPAPPVVDFTKLDITDMQLTQVRGVVSLFGTDDFERAFANINVTMDGEQFDSTTNARIVLSNGDEITDIPDFDVDEDTQADRIALLALMASDPAAADHDVPFLVQLDFQASDQLGEHLAPFHSPVTEHTLYTDATGIRKYGWDSLAGVKAGLDKGKATSLERDSVKVLDGAFIIDLAGPGGGPGTYNISITVGDREEIQESLQVTINGYQADRVSTMPGDFLTRTYQVNTLDSQLLISLQDIGGKHNYFSVNGIAVEKVNYRSYITPTEQLDNDPSVVVITQSYELPETSAGIEIYKEALKAAAMAALTAGAGAVLTAAGPLGGTIATGLGGGFKAGALAAKASAAGITNAIASSIGSAAVKAAGWSLVTSVPQNFISDPSARGVLAGTTSIFFGAKGIHDSGLKLDKFGEIAQERDVLSQINGGLKAISGGLTIANSSVAAMKGLNQGDHTAPWVYEIVNSLATMTQQFRLGKLDTAFVPVDLDDVEAAIAAGKSLEQILKKWQGSRDFLIIDWVPTRDKLTEIDVDDHLDYVNRSAKVLKNLLEAYVEHIQESSAQTELDLLFMSHGAGYEINRETANRLNASDVADALDYVKFVTLDPYASSQDAFTWYHPEMTSIVDRVDNVYQTTEVSSSLWAALGGYPIVSIGASPGGSDLYHGGSDLGGLDGREGGGSAGFYNRQARIFDLESTDELLRFRHWDTNKVELSTAELTDIEFSPDGSLVAASGKDGIVTVRYVDDAPEPDPETGELPHAAGDVKFIVWGQEAKVRSVAFMQMEVDGQWKDYLLTISAAKKPENNDIDKNKVLLTDVETGLPVWQGKDVAGTQVEASPSGNVIVSTDSNGHAKIWKRVNDTVTFELHGQSVDAHTGPNKDYIADVYVINDRYFATAGLDGRMKLFKIDDLGAVRVQTEVFDSPVRNLDYDPYNGILVVAAGEELSFWKFDQTHGTLDPLAPSGQSIGQRFIRHDHVADIQGVSFSKPTFLLDADGEYSGDRSITTADGVVVELPRTTETGDIDIAALPQFLVDNGLTGSYAGLKLLTGGEDKTLFLYSLDGLNVGSVREESVLSGSMLPIREVTLSPDGRRVAVVGQDNVDEDQGGPVKDIDVTGTLDDRLGWKFSERFLQGRREHNAVPQQYIYDVVEEKGESYFWLRNSANANRPGDLDKDRNLALPPNKRDNIPGVDIAPMDLYLRPGQKIDIKPLQYLLEVNRKDYAVDKATLVLGNVTDIGDPTNDDDDIVVGTIKLKRIDGKDRPNILVFEAADDLDYTAANRNEFVGTFKFDINGPDDLEGNPRRIENVTIQFRIINHKPVAYRDVVNLHPNREEIDFRPRANDYDFDNDDFGIIPLPTTWQSLTFEDEEVARYRRHPDPDHNRGVDIEVTVTHERLETLLSEQVAAGENPRKYLSLEISYAVREHKYKAVSNGVIEVRLQLQAGPENVRYTEPGADQVVIQWDPVSWNANKYVIERYDDVDGWTKHSPNSDVNGRLADSRQIKIEPDKDHWFRVVAKNTNSDRVHASHEGDDKEGGLYVPKIPYVGPAGVDMDVRGAAQIEVRWEKVFWNVDRYRVELRELTVDIDGNIELDANGDFEFNPNNVRFDVIHKSDGLTKLFTRLNTATPYLAVVIAKNSDGTVAEQTVASTPVFTSGRVLPAGIQFERTGPEKVRVSWGTVDYADKYRIVAFDPVTLERVASKVFTADNNQNTNDGVLDGLPKADQDVADDWVIIVDARHRKTGKWVSLISDDPFPPIFPNREILAADIDVTTGGVPTFILDNAFSHSVTVPSLAGLIVGTEFRILNFSTNSVVFNSATPDQMIRLSGISGTEHSLPSAFGNDPTGKGIVNYHFIATESSSPGGLEWTIQIGDEASEARVLTTPPFLAAEPYGNSTLLKKGIDSLPKQLQVNWVSPFWDVNKHTLNIFEVVTTNGTDTLVSAGPRATRTLANLTGKERTHTFKELKPDTEYLLRLTTTGAGNTRVAEQLFRTDPQRSPSGVMAVNETLTSFEAAWNSEDWKVQRYRVSFAKVGADGQLDESTRDYRYVPDVTKTSKLVEGLESGVTYSFTVEAESKDDGWLTNTEENTKSVNTLMFALPEGVWLESPDQASTSISLDWSWVYSTQIDEQFNFGADSTHVFWRRLDDSTGNPSSDKVTGSDPSYVITGLDHDVAYDVWVEFRASGFATSPLTLRTDDEVPVSTLPAQAPQDVGIVAGETGRHRFVVSWSHSNPDNLSGYTVEVFDGAVWRPVAHKDNGGFVNGTNLNRGTNKQFEITHIRNASNNWKLLKAGAQYPVRVTALFEGGDSAVNQDDPSVTAVTESLVAPTELVVTDVSLTEFRINWEHDDPAGGVDFFRIRIKAEGDSDWTVVKENLAANDRAALITELTPGQRYMVQVRAVYVQVATDRDFESADAETGPHHTDSAPAIDGLFTDGITLSTATLRWNRLTGLGVTRYEIVLYKNAVQFMEITTGAGSGTRHLKAVTSLDHGTTYEFKVVAYNGTVKLSESALHEFSTLIDGLTVDEESLTSARANWTQFAGDSATDYRVRVFVPETNQVVAQKTVSVGSGLRRTTMTGLSAGKNYEMQVEVMKNQTVLSYSARVGFSTASPPAVPGLAVDQINLTSARANWDQVTGAGVTDYRVRVYLRGSHTVVSEKTVNVGAGTRRTTMTGLWHSTSYDMSVEAVKNGSLISTSGRVPFFTENPPAISGLSVDEITPGSARANWNQVTGLGVTHYRIRVYQGANTIVSTKTVDVGSGRRRTTLAGLAAGTNYEMFVEALANGKVVTTSSRVAFTTLNRPSGLSVDGGSGAIRRRQVDLRWNTLGWTPSSQYIEVKKAGTTSWVRPTGGGVQIGKTKNTISELARGTTYQIRLVAKVTLSDGEILTVFSNVIIVTTDS